jgi:cyanophycinase
MFIAAEIPGPYVETLLQRFWDEAGAYGARIVLLAVVETDGQRVEQIFRTFVDWESDTVTTLQLDRRIEALDRANIAAIDGATGILLVGDDPLAASITLGGTPVAQAIRKANARNKVVGAFGGCASILCQHMLTFQRWPQSTDSESSPMVQFIPGLGLLNRLALDAQPASPDRQTASTPRLTLAVAHNPFLTPVQMASNTGVVVYPDSTLEVFGSGIAHLVDGSNITSISLGQSGNPSHVIGATDHTLGPGYTYNFDTRTITEPDEGELPPSIEDTTSAF